MSAVEGCWRQWCISAEDCSVLRQRVGDKGSKQQRHVSQISSACCLRNGCTPEPLWDARGCVFCGGGWRAHTHTVSCWGCHSLCAAASQFYIHLQLQQACEDEEKCFPFLWILRLFLLFSFLEAGLQCVFIRGLLDAHHSFVLFLLFFSHVGAHQVGYLITEYFLLFWILIFIVESNNPMSLELFSSWLRIAVWQQHASALIARLMKMGVSRWVIHWWCDCMTKNNHQASDKHSLLLWI